MSYTIDISQIAGLLPWIETWIGAIIAHMLTVYGKDFKGAIPFLTQLVPGKTPAFYFRLNFILLPIIGTVIAMITMEPDGWRNCIFAGLSWEGSLNLIIHKSEKSPDSN